MSTLTKLPPITFRRARGTSTPNPDLSGERGATVTMTARAVAGASSPAALAAIPATPAYVELQERLASALQDVHSFLTRFVHFGRPEQPVALSLWIAYTHFFGRGQPSFSFVPYALVTSAERQSGKSTVLEIAGMLAHDPLLGQSMSPALVGRTCAKRTLLLDEIDGVYTARAVDDPAAGDLRTILNAGFKYDGKYDRLDKATMKPLSFSVYGPKMLVGIGRSIPDTVADRSIAIRMERKAHDNTLPKFREKRERPEADELRSRLSALAGEMPPLPEVDIDAFPDALDGRRQDIWEPLYALAGGAGQKWYDNAVTASLVLTAAEPSVSLGVHLLTDLRRLFEDLLNPAFISTTDLIGQPASVWPALPARGLCAIEESPWATFNHGKPISAHRVAGLLKEFDIVPDRDPDGAHGYTHRGYRRRDFEKAWQRYLDPGDTE